MEKNIAVIILAAGLGTRMKSDRAKVLHEIQNRAMILYVVEAARNVAGDDVIVVVGNQAEEVRRIISDSGSAGLMYAYQEKQLGTAHAVMCALPHIPEYCQEVVILCGDVPLVLPETITDLVEEHSEGNHDISLLAVELENPYGYGRIVQDDSGHVCGIIEEADATAEQKQIKLINAGIYCVDKSFLLEALPRIESNNAQDELYLTDIVAVGYRQKKQMGVRVCTDCLQILGVNNPQDLEAVDAVMEKRNRIIP